MNKTDSPLKRLVQIAPHDFAEWLLKRKVITITSANIELQPNPNATYSDLVFWVTVQPGEDDEQKSPYQVLLHIEFQGKSSERPMRLRVLDYIVGFTDQERRMRIHSVVFYIGEKTNVTDTGHHQVMGIGNRVTLAWQYDVVHLWTLDPLKLLAEGRPVLLPLVGQTKLEQPQEIIPQVYQSIRSVPDRETQHRLLIELLALLQDEEIVKMIETMMEQDEWSLDTPYLRRWRQQIEAAQEEARNARDEGRKAREEGHLEGRREGRLEGRKEERESRRQDILKLILWRYKPYAEDYLKIQTFLSSIMADTKLKDIFDAIMNIEDFQQFYQFVEESAQSTSELEAVAA
ncbi:MAG: hypothetical protein AAF639_25940 [Chloroflexota bacterium]